MARIDLVGIGKTFRKKTALGPAPFSINGLDLIIPDGKTTVILGPSGCGKTTLLRLIAGLETPDSGEIRFDGINVNRLPPKNRKIGMVFQNYALFPHMKAKANILSYFLFRQKTPELDAEAEERLKKTSELLGVEISYLLDRSPKNLSGGERQRVAIGRCITRDPSLFLLDEPFSSLDAQLREKYRFQLKRLLKMFGVTAVYITHDQQEAMVLADNVVVMHEGRIEQTGTYQDIYLSPASLFVAEFLNPDSEVPALVRLDGKLFGRPECDAGVRPRQIAVSHETAGAAMAGTVAYANPLPVKNVTVLNIRSGEVELLTTVPMENQYEAGQAVGLHFREYFLFDRAGGKRVS